MESCWPRAAEVPAGAEEDVLTYMSFPQEHWTRIYSTSPLERLDKAVERRTNVVGVFSNTDAVLRLVESVLLEIHEERQVRPRYFSQKSMRKLKAPDEHALTDPAPLRLAPIQ
jgi:putative transposase